MLDKAVMRSMGEGRDFAPQNVSPNIRLGFSFAPQNDSPNIRLGVNFD